MTDFETHFAKVAKLIADKASHEDTPFAEVIDAFKAMTAYYALVLKKKGGDNGEPHDGFDFANGIEDTKDGRGVSGRRSS